MTAFAILFGCAGALVGYLLGLRTGHKEGAVAESRRVAQALDRWAERNPLDAQQLRRLLAHDAGHRHA